MHVWNSYATATVFSLRGPQEQTQQCQFNRILDCGTPEVSMYCREATYFETTLEPLASIPSHSTYTPTF